MDFGGVEVAGEQKLGPVLRAPSQAEEAAAVWEKVGPADIVIRNRDRPRRAARGRDGIEPVSWREDLCEEDRPGPAPRAGILSRGIADRLSRSDGQRDLL